MRTRAAYSPRPANTSLLAPPGKPWHGGQVPFQDPALASEKHPFSPQPDRQRKRGVPTAVCSPHFSAANGQKGPPDHREDSSPKDLLPARALWTNIPPLAATGLLFQPTPIFCTVRDKPAKRGSRRQNSFPYAKPHPCPCSVTKCLPNPAAVAPFPTSTNSPRLWQINCKRPPGRRTAPPAQSRSPAGIHCQAPAQPAAEGPLSTQRRSPTAHPRPTGKDSAARPPGTPFPAPRLHPNHSAGPLPAFPSPPPPQGGRDPSLSCPTRRPFPPTQQKKPAPAGTGSLSF